MNAGFLKSNAPRLAVAVLLAAGSAACVLLGWHRYLSFSQLLAQRDGLIAAAHSHPLLAPLFFCAAYIVLGLGGLPGSTARRGLRRPDLLDRPPPPRARRRGIANGVHSPSATGAGYSGSVDERS
jgi:hypothetical protein